MSDPSTIVTGAQVVSDATPYVNAVVGVVISGLGGFLALLVKRYVGVTISQDALAKVEDLAMQYAAAEVAKAADNLATAQIDVKSPLVKTLADQVAANLPKELDLLGLSTNDVAKKVTAAFGMLQSNMTAIPAALPASADAAAPLSQTGGLGVKK